MTSLRRLIKDYANLRAALPPNYLFADDEDGSSTSDDLSQLVILVTGAKGTPYTDGLWRLHLKIPDDYPQSPPKATFKTRIYHPNVDEKTGAVCLETLKRDWDPKLTLKDILITISCLLIQPNPDSALNASAGALIQEDYDAFATQAALMTGIHAPIPKHLADAVLQARRRGEDAEQQAGEYLAAIREESEEDDMKENDPNQSDILLTCRGNEQQSSRAKRPLSEIVPLEDVENQLSTQPTSEPKKKSPKTASTSRPSKVAGTEGPDRDLEAGKGSIAPFASLAVEQVVLRKASKAMRKGPRVGIRRL